jgi:nicotinamidase-related amidase
MNTALLVIDVQQGLCEGEHAAFESQQVIARINQVCGNAHLSAAQVIQQHNDTLTNINSFGPRVRAVSTDKLRFDAIGQQA